VKLRNPWGLLEWKGRAGRGDRQFWTSIPSADRQRLSFSESERGSFFMLWEDFVNFFDILSICKLQDNASYSSCQCEFSRKRAQMLEFETKGGSLTLTLSQSADSLGTSRVFARSIVIVARQEQASKGFQYRYVKSSTNNLFPEHNVELNNLPQGKYVVYAKYLWQNKVDDTATISIYTESPTHLVLISQSKHKSFLYQTFLDHARSNPNKQSLGQGEWMCNDLLLSECGYGYLAFHLDEHSTRKLGIELSERYNFFN
jgi:hypothetical protein